VVGVGLGGVTWRHNCDGSQPLAVGQAADQASEVSQVDAGTTADSSDLKATPSGASCTTSHTAAPASKPDSDPPGPPPTTLTVAQIESNLTGTVALVTGASNGIGATTTRRLADHGASVALVARRRDRLEALAAEIDQAGGTALVAATDQAGWPKGRPGR
jgi:short chain dehydrogenase